MTKTKKSRKQTDIDRVARHLYHEYVKNNQKDNEKYRDELKRISESVDFDMFVKQAKNMKNNKKDKFDKIFNELEKKTKKRKKKDKPKKDKKKDDKQKKDKQKKDKKKKDTSEGKTKKRKKESDVTKVARYFYYEYVKKNRKKDE